MHSETHTHDKVSKETNKPTEETPRILTFSELQELITQGKTDQIPNNKIIPDAIHVIILLLIPVPELR